MGVNFVLMFIPNLSVLYLCKCICTIVILSLVLLLQLLLPIRSILFVLFQSIDSVLSNPATANDEDRSIVISDDVIRHSSTDVKPLSSDWSNIDLFKQFHEASKDCSPTPLKSDSLLTAENTGDGFDDAEFEDYLASEDFQCFAIDTPRTELVADRSADLFQTHDQKYSSTLKHDSSSGKEFTERFPAMNAAAIVGSINNNNNVNRKTGRSTFSEVEFSQSIAKSRLKDFTPNPGWRRLSFDSNHRGTNDSSSATTGQQESSTSDLSATRSTRLEQHQLAG